MGEFKELGFEFEAEFKNPLTSEAEEWLSDCFLSEVVEPRSLALGGWITNGFITYYGRGSATEEDRDAISAWLTTRPEIGSFKVGELMDAWHSPEYGALF